MDLSLGRRVPRGPRTGCGPNDRHGSFAHLGLDPTRSEGGPGGGQDRVERADKGDAGTTAELTLDERKAADAVKKS